MLHLAYMSGTRPDTLTPEQAETLDAAERDTGDFIARFAGMLGIDEGEPYRDVREITLKFTADGETLFPGHADFVRYWPRKNAAVVCDAKFGFMEVEDAADNLQIASYAAMLRQAMPELEIVAVAIVQPRNFGPRMSQAIYTRSMLTAAEREIDRIYAATLAPDAPLVASESACHWCKAKPICPAYKAKFLSIAELGSRAVSTLSNDELERTHTAIQFANKIKDDVSAELRARIEAGTLPGWKLQGTGDARELNDPLGLFTAMQEHFRDNPTFSATGFDKCRKIVWSALEEYVGDLTGMSEKKAKEAVKMLSEPFVTATPKAKRAVREKTGKALTA